MVKKNVTKKSGNSKGAVKTGKKTKGKKSMMKSLGAVKFGGIVTRVKGILMSPKGEWKKIAGEKASLIDLFVKYMMILALIPAVCMFIGFCVIGWGRDANGHAYKMPIVNGIIWAVSIYIGYLIGALFFGFIIDFLAPYFGAKKDMVGSTKCSVYAMTPGLLAGVVYLFLYMVPPLAIIPGLCGIYSLILLYFGMETIKKSSQHVIYYFVSLAVAMVVWSVVWWLVWTFAYGAHHGTHTY